MPTTFRRIAFCIAVAVLGLQRAAWAADGPERLAEASGKEFEAALKQFSKQDNPFVKKALEIRDQVIKSNQQDLQSLCDRLHGCFPKGTCLMQDQAFLDKLVAKLKADKAAYVKIKKALDSASGQGRGSEELRSSLGKLIGTEAHPGILDNAVGLLSASDERKKDILDKDPKDVNPRYNEITVLKTLYFYSYLVAKGRDNLTPDEAKDFARKIQMLYPADVPKGVNSLVQCTGLACQNEDGKSVDEKSFQLLVPNAGYIWGGDLVGGKCRGMDCSAFLSRCTESPRLSTINMEYIWRSQAAPEKMSAKEKGVFKELMKEADMRRAIELFEAIVLAPGEHPKPGDLVVWRWGNPDNPWKRAGHVTMYLGPAGDSGGEFYGIEANRSDDTSFEKANQTQDNSFEGMLIRRKGLERENAQTYVLRRRPLH